MTGHDACATPDGEAIMPLNEMPKCLRPETRSLIDSALEQAWQELKEDGPADVALAPRKLAGTIVALASVDETDPAKLTRLALHAARGTRVGALGHRKERRVQQRSLRGEPFYAGRTQEHW
jgi:hypothetical protein